ncbi:MAG: hypothetical protein QF906_04100 [Dehalococcoidales bacterium]|nr:hypothetical protein [Dehalococcoidales bacterium]MDP7285664.1 hypothetical protein [Dehalococcoidales bacterium]MDP7416011.1 hypothetical protein [Dehalococcoidales bacterium]
MLIWVWRPHAPEEVAKGAAVVTRKYGVQIALVGPSETMVKELANHGVSGLDIEIVNASEYLVEREPPVYTLRQKRDASIIVASAIP